MTIAPGTRSTSLDGLNTPKSFSKFVATLEARMLASLKSQKSSRRQTSRGHSRPSWITRTTGSKRKEGELMHPAVAQGFLRLCVSSEQAEKLKKVSVKLPTGRYLMPFEAFSILRMQPSGKTVTEHEDAQMLSLWNEFCEELDIDQRSSFTNQVLLTRWWDYVAKNYTEPLPVASEQKSWMD